PQSWFRFTGWDLDVHPAQGDVLVQPWTSPSQKSNMGPNARRAENALESTQEETMQFKHVTLDFDGPVAVLRLDHQEVMNAVSIDMLGGLAEALDEIEERK